MPPILTAKRNLKALMDLPGAWMDRVRQRRALDKLILDVDSSVSETYGRREGSAYNGHFECMCYHPIFQMAEVAVPRNSFAAILDRIQRLGVVASMVPS